MRTLITIVVISMLIVSCSKTNQETGDVADPQIQLMLARGSNMQYPTLQRKPGASEEAKYAKLVDDIYSAEFQDFVLEQNSDVADLTDRYNALLNSQNQDLYQQEYLRSGLSKKILLNLDLINTLHFNSISFFINQLLDSQIGEYQVIIRGLEKVEGKIPFDQFRQMSAKLHRQIAKSRSNEVETLRAVKTLIAEREEQLTADPGNERARFSLEMIKEMDLNARLNTLENCSERLSKL